MSERRLVVGRTGKRHRLDRAHATILGGHWTACGLLLLQSYLQPEPNKQTEPDCQRCLALEVAR